MTVGIDIGSTTTKAIVIQSDKILYRLKTKAIDPVTSATGIIGKLTQENDIDIGSIEKIVITGVGSSKINKQIFDIPTEKIDEITAIGNGGLFLLGKNKMLITNIGTGTVFIEATKERITHIGGTGVGGGTIIGLSKALLHTSDFVNIMNIANYGNLKEVDLLVEDIIDTKISFLSSDATASNFGKMLDTANDHDKAKGILNLVYQVIGMLSVFTAQGRNYSSVVITGSGSNNLVGQQVLGEISKMYKIDFEYPNDAEFVTAVGAAVTKCNQKCI